MTSPQRANLAAVLFTMAIIGTAVAGLIGAAFVSPSVTVPPPPRAAPPPA